MRGFSTCSKHHSVDYVTPLKFAAITIGKFARQESEVFLKFVHNKLDGLKYLLIATTEIAHYNKKLVLAEGFKVQIRERMYKEFWIIEAQNSDPVLKESLDYYKGLKEIVLGLC